MPSPDSRTVPCTVFFQTREKYPKDADDSTMARYLKKVLFLRLPEMQGEMAQRKNQLYEGEKKIEREKYQNWS